MHKIKRTLAYLILLHCREREPKIVNIWTLKAQEGNSCFLKEGAGTINWNKSGGTVAKKIFWWGPLPSPSSSSSPKNVMSVSSFYGFQGEMREWRKIKEKHGKPSLLLLRLVSGLHKDSITNNKSYISQYSYFEIKLSSKRLMGLYKRYTRGEICF